MKATYKSLVMEAAKILSKMLPLPEASAMHQALLTNLYELFDGPKFREANDEDPMQVGSIADVPGFDRAVERLRFAPLSANPITAFVEFLDGHFTTPAATTPAASESDALAELNHAQYISLENCRLFAARHHKEEWAQHILRFCDEAHVRAVHLRQCTAAQVAANKPAAPSRDTIRATFMANGFTIKEGQTDLKDYVYRAAEALFGKPAAASGDVVSQGVDTEVLYALLDQLRGAHSAVVDVGYCPSSEPFKAAQKQFNSAYDAISGTIAALAAPQHQVQAGGDAGFQGSITS